nr:BTB/POZ and TAZ domain-containing protein 1 [Lilium hybrid division I]
MKAYPQSTGIDTIPADARIITPGGQSIPAHCSILASASPVLESLLYQPTRRRWNAHDHKTIFIPGVPYEAIEAFLSLIYSPRCLKKETGKEAMKMYGMHLLVLSHAYSIGWLKRAAELALAEQLTTEVVVDVLHLARQCDASQLYIRCMKWIAKNFAAVEKTEGWRFVHAHDPWLEINVLQFLQDTDLRINRRRKKMWEQGLYLQLSEAMECLVHICTEGCIGVGPYDMNLARVHVRASKHARAYNFSFATSQFADGSKAAPAASGCGSSSVSTPRFVSNLTAAKFRFAGSSE